MDYYVMKNVIMINDTVDNKVLVHILHFLNCIFLTKP